MNKAQIDRYFTVLSKLYPKPCRIILTGAAAGALYGRVRATMDVDFGASAKDWDGLTKAIRLVQTRTGISSQYTEDIDRWSSITFLDYRKHTYLYRRFGRVEVRLMEPSYWAIGKLARYLDPDIQDLIRVLKKTKETWRDVAGVAGKALRASPRSTASTLFRKQVEDFLGKHGRSIWGRSFKKEDALSHFHKQARIF